jgi:hypothetical protein
MISYEASKWYVKLWRQRWYLYAIFLHILQYFNIDLWVDYLINQGLDDSDKKKIKSDWKEIKRHVELSKMYKFSAKYHRED